MQWTDIFTEVSRRKVGNCRSKTLPADQITWQGLFGGHPISVVSTVRLVLGGLAHFNVSSAARIGAHAWELPGGYYIDVMAETRDRIGEEDLLAIGQLAAAADERPICVRRRGGRLAQGRYVGRTEIQSRD